MAFWIMELLSQVSRLFIITILFFHNFRESFNNDLESGSGIEISKLPTTTFNTISEVIMQLKKFMQL